MTSAPGFQETVLWPKMVLEYKEDGDDLSPITAPIRDQRGYVLGMKVKHGQNRQHKVYLDWFPPEPE